MRIQGLSGLLRHFSVSSENEREELRAFVRGIDTLFFYMISFPENTNFNAKIEAAKDVYNKLGLSDYFSNLVPKLEEEFQLYGEPPKDFESYREAVLTLGL